MKRGCMLCSRIFWCGDLNYRLYLEDNLTRDLIKKQDWKALQEFDQLRRELDEGGVFEGWTEGNIEFAPTYKYSSSNCNRYSGGLPCRSGEKQRTPAWCDRILWYGKGVKQLSYFRSESKFSDHRPVSALFSIPVEVTKATNTAIAMPNLLPTIVSPEDKVNARLYFGRSFIDGYHSIIAVLRGRKTEKLKPYLSCYSNGKGPRSITNKNAELYG